MTDESQQLTSGSGSEPPKLEINATRQFTQWLVEQETSLAFSTYQTGKLFFIGTQPSGNLSVFERTFNRCMGLYAPDDARRLYMSSLYQLWRFEPAFDRGQDYEGYDCMYIPRVGYTTGDIDIHDIALNAEDQPVFVSTLFSCLATPSETHSFKPIWKPPFISKLAAEDRCHLNGLAMVAGKPRYVTSVSRSDVADGWREHRRDGGVLMDVESGEYLVEGLSMPHSPRWYQDKLWLLDSGTGYFGYVDLKLGRFEKVAFCAGFLRGLVFINHFAVVGLSLPRHNRTFQGLPLDDNLNNKHASARCGLQVIDLITGDVVHGLRIEGIVEELYDVVVLKGIQRPMALGFKTDEIRRILSVEE
ncbi:MAG: TIGR03032 family protein [Gammaproteobacteria bacterium]|nr:TIGR03032 family protein [Gammaproteobacteria bacterium]